MIGYIDKYDPELHTGIIKSEGGTYEFEIEDWIADVPPDEGDDVRFDLENGKITRINLAGVHIDQPKPVKNKYIAGILSLLLGWAGLSRFYLGYYRIGFIQIALTALLFYAGFIVFIPQWGFVEAILLFSNKFDRDAQGRPLK